MKVTGTPGHWKSSLEQIRSVCFCETGPLKSVEKYDVINDVWHPCQPMPCPLMVKCAAVDDVIYVLAGKGNEKLRRVLKYNTRTDKLVSVLF